MNTIKLYLKITNPKENHNGFPYHDGENVLIGEFNDDPTASCVRGGLYFTDIEHILEFLNYGTYVRVITLPINDPDFKMVKDGKNKWRANKIILGKRYNLCDVSTFQYLLDQGADIHAIANKKVFRWACKNGYLEVAKWLWQLGNEISSPINIHAHDEYAFRYACEKGHLEIAQWLHLLGNKLSSPIDIHAYNEHAFECACEKGHLEIAKWLYILGNEIGSPINIHADDEFAFRYACHNKHLEIAKWLYLLGNETGSPINIHANNEYAFRSACYDGHLEIAKWLYLLGNEIGSPINIHVDNEFAFRWACKNSHLEVAKWLCILCDKYNIDVSPNNKIRYSIN